MVTGRRGALAVFLIPLIASFFAFGFWWSYWRVGDMDLWMVYEAFLLNDRLPQEYFDHPAYLTILSLWQWFKLLHSVGLLPVHALSELPPPGDVQASAAAWMHAVQVARVLSLFIALAFVNAFAFLLRRLLCDWRIAALAAFMLAFSGGLMMQSRIVRTELIAAGLAYCALLLLLIAAVRTRSAARPLLIGAAALLATLAMLNKVQIVLLLGTFPPILLLFGRDAEAAPKIWRPLPREVLLVLGYVSVAAALTLLAWPTIAAGLFDPAAVAERARLTGSAVPIYQTFIAAWVAGWMIAFALRFRIAAMESIAAGAAVVSGVAAGLLVLALHYDVQNAVTVMNPLERMLGFAAESNPALLHAGALSAASVLHALVDGVVLLIERLTFVLSSSPRPTIFLEWVVIAAAVWAWRRGERSTALQALALLAAASVVDLVGTLRGLKLEYFILTDPLVVIAAAWLMSRMRALQYHRWMQPVGFTLMLATVCVGMAEPIKHSMKTSIPLAICTPHNIYTPRIERFSFCPK
jgi:hypothetical protein